MDPAYTWKLIGVALYLGVLLGIGVAASRRMGDLKDYFAGGKDLGFLAVAFSARATGESAWLLLGLTGMGALYGVRGFWVVVGEVIGVVGAWVFMARPFKRLTDRYDSITVPDYLESRFRDEGSHGLRMVAAVCLTVFVTIYVSAQIDATGKAFETFLPPSKVFLLGDLVAGIGDVWLQANFDYIVGALVGFAVVMAYSTSGGFLAVVWSDIFQGVLMFLGLVVLPIAGMAAIGGPGVMMDKLSAIDPTLLHWGGAHGWTLMTLTGTIGLALIGLGFLGSPQIFVRFLALRDEGEIPQGTAVAFIWTLLADSGAVLTGMVGRAMLTEPGQDAEAVLASGGEAVLPQLVEMVMPGMIVGLYIAIVLSAIMSTVDSLLVVAASAAVRDFYQKVLNPSLKDEDLVSLSRYTTFALALVALVISMVVARTAESRTVFWFVIFGWSGIAATFCPTMILSLYWRGFSRNGAMAAMLSGFAGVPLFKFAAPLLPAVGPYFKELGELPAAFALSFAVGVLVSLAMPGERQLDAIPEASTGR